MASFKCWEDCRFDGCPGHTVEVRRQNSVNLLHFIPDGNEKNERLIPEVEFKAMMEAYLAKYPD